MTATEVAQRYQAELCRAAQLLQQKGTETVEDVQTFVKDLSGIVMEKTEHMQHIIEEVKTQTIDQSPIEDDDKKFVCETFLWLAVCFVALTCGNIIGYICSFALSIVLGPIETLLLTYIAIPALFLLHHSKQGTQLIDEQRRTNSAALSLLIGILVGFELSDLKLSFFAPPAFLIHLSVGFTASILGSSNRLQLISTALGGSMAVYTIWAFVVGGGVSFLLWALILCAMAAVDLQLKIAQYRSGSHNIIRHQLQTIIGYIIIQSALTFAFSGSSTSKAAQKESDFNSEPIIATIKK